LDEGNGANRSNFGQHRSVAGGLSCGERVVVMKAKLTKGGCTLVREPDDKRISHESTVGYHMKKLLNSQGHKFVRMYPNKHGLTACRLGLIEHKTGIVLWHERYAIENAATEFNRGEVYLQRVNQEVD
jgi:hypothetical protein